MRERRETEQSGEGHASGCNGKDDNALGRGSKRTQPFPGEISGWAAEHGMAVSQEETPHNRKASRRPTPKAETAEA